jgi:hypothetical protein
MLIGQFLASAEDPYHSPWFPSGGNELTSVVDVIRVIGGGTIDVAVETKNSEQDDSNATSLGSSGTITTEGRTVFTVGTSIDRNTGTAGFFELTRYVYTVGGASAGDGVHMRMQNPSWLGH